MQESRERAFVADVDSPEQRRLYLSHTGIERSSFGSFENLGWELVITRFSDTAEEITLSDHWEQTLLEILRYPGLFSDAAPQWRWLSSGAAADLRTLQPGFDASARFETAEAVKVSPDGTKRLCFNRFDDGSWRFTLEEQVSDGGLTAWVAIDWSVPHPDILAAQATAQSKFAWLTS